MDVWLYGCMVVWMDGWMDACGFMDGWMDIRATSCILLYNSRVQAAKPSSRKSKQRQQPGSLEVGLSGSNWVPKRVL